jgi:uncharacterized protein (DUF2126 family)/transglutaminase-like putative cysteine protease
MALHIALNHQTHYRYDRPVTLSPHVVRLRPAPHCRTPILSYSLRVTPEKHFINWQQDPFGNYLARLVFNETARELLVEVDLVAEMSVINPFSFFLEPSAETFPFVYEPSLRKDLAPFLESLPAGPLLREYLAGIDRKPVRTIDFVVELNRRLQQVIKYIIRMEPGVQAPEETLGLRSGSCRDTGWLLVQVMRHLGLAARFVSGYLVQLTADVKALDGPSGPVADFTDLHAWAEVYLPGAGWVGLDPTSGLLAGEGHIPLACAPDPVGAAPVTGAVDKCEVAFTHTMSVRRIFESPRVTKPYTEKQWHDIEALGHDIDSELNRGDVRLTMGGEPTFVSIDDMDGAEWNIAALGTNKRKLAGSLIKRLRKQFGPGGLLHYGQGKWYPGETLPRWALGCYWRRDGVPIWRDDSLICDETMDYHHGNAEAQSFITLLTQNLGVEPRFAIPAYEDVWYYLWKERRLPTNVDPFKSELKDEEERKRLARIFEQGLSKIVGFVLPLQRRFKANPGAYWASGPWFFRTEHMFLLPGDSPVGYRLPMDSLAWVTPGQYPYLYEADPHVTHPPPPERPLRGRQQQRLPSVARSTERVGFAEQQLDGVPISPDRIHRGESAPWVIRTALCVEPRNGRLHVFMPPVRFVEDYLDLVAAVEDTAAELELPVIIEGERPPKDARINHLNVTPDPGVIEVNLQPARNWDELVNHTTVLYEEARQSRLGAEKFMLDGRHVGTGGGNHIVIGGSTPSDSPLLRRPDLLRSLVGYWHNHPSLSFLFSGLFIGPTSQHPRVDEARNDSLYELEIAFRQIPDRGGCLPWVVDRAFRNLLIDVSGNTHRAEFCIDKLFPTDASSTRLGLLELRSFEMPPHARMSLTQQLLLRTLIARFWKQPFNQKLVRWGTELHDRFMLPHFVAQDFNDVLSDLGAAGYPLQPEWFAPHHEFRFPQHGAIAQRGIVVELRHALEPWHVMGEEAGAGGTARFVDSSVERLQVKVNGMTNTRHFIACNGRRVPLHPTGTVGEFVAGVRYRAWQPPSCLHPMIPVHSPLVVDIVDSWNGRSLGGCTYHVAHPGGRSYETFPVNAYEAESRRRARFFDFGHTPGPMDVPSEERTADFPFTLDLRRP